MINTPITFKYAEEADIEILIEFMRELYEIDGSSPFDEIDYLNFIWRYIGRFRFQFFLMFLNLHCNSGGKREKSISGTPITKSI